MEINVIQVLGGLLKKWWIIVASAICCMLLLFAYSMMTATPTYTSSTKLYVITQDNTQMTTTEVKGSAEIVSTYIEILKSRAVLETVSNNLSQLGYSWSEIKDMIVASQVEETPIFQIAVTCSNPSDAQLIAYEIASVGAPQIKDIVNAGDVKVVDQASDAEMNSPGHAKKAIIGFLIGFIIATLILALIEIFDKRVKTEIDITDTIDYPIVGVIPQIH